MRIFTKNSKILFICCFFAISLSAFYVTYYYQSALRSHSFSLDGRLPLVEKSEVSVNISDRGSKEIQFLDPLNDAVMRNEVSDWFASRGVFTEETIWNDRDKTLSTAYDSYDDDTLRHLGEEGDLRALHVLARRMDTFEARDLILGKAAIYGSTQALGEIGLGFSVSANLSTRSADERKPMYIESLAYYEAAQLRGDWTQNMIWGRILRENSDVVFTKKDELQIQRRAQEIYDDLQSKRYALGLGDFDNSIPEAVMRDYEATLQSLSAIDRNP